MTRRRNVLRFRSESEVAVILPRVCSHLRAGGLIAYPTETVYGLGGLPTEAAIRGVAALKGRSGQMPFLLIVSRADMVDSLGLQWTDASRRMAEKFWPGPLTIVFRPLDPSLPGALLGPGGGVAVRWTSHSGITRLLDNLGHALTSTSANLHGNAPARSADDVVGQFHGRLQDDELILLDGGELPLSLPSTVVDCTDGSPRIIRAGAISIAELRCIAPDLKANG